jgi:uncharacterized protein YnzC (UPF0291/DUF896 family)
LFVPIAIWVIRGINTKIEKVNDLLAKTREEYATRYEMREQMAHLMDAMHRLEDKLDRVLREK